MMAYSQLCLSEEKCRNSMYLDFEALLIDEC